MVSKSPNWGYSPSKWPKWLIHGGLLATYLLGWSSNQDVSHCSVVLCKPLPGPCVAQVPGPCVAQVPGPRAAVQVRSPLLDPSFKESCKDGITTGPMRLMFCSIGHFPIDWYHDDWWCTGEKYKLLDSASSFGTKDTFVQKELILVQHLAVTCSCCMICSVPLNLFAKSRSLRFGRNLHMEDCDGFCCALLSFHLLSSAGGLWGKAVPAKAQVAGTPSGGIAECHLANSRQVSTDTHRDTFRT